MSEKDAVALVTGPFLCARQAIRMMKTQQPESRIGFCGAVVRQASAGSPAQGLTVGELFEVSRGYDRLLIDPGGVGRSLRGYRLS